MTQDSCYIRNKHCQDCVSHLTHHLGLVSALWWVHIWQPCRRILWVQLGPLSHWPFSPQLREHLFKEGRKHSSRWVAESEAHSLKMKFISLGVGVFLPMAQVAKFHSYITRMTDVSVVAEHQVITGTGKHSSSIETD